MEPREFLEKHPPFDRLSPAELGIAENALAVVYVARGESVLRRADGENPYLFVVRKGAIRLETDGRLLQTVEEGEPFGFPSLLAGTAPHADAVAEEDALVYRFERATFQKLMANRRFADFFLTGLAERLRRAAGFEAAPLAGDLSTTVDRLVTRPPVLVDRLATAGEAAREMTRQRVSSLLVGGRDPGILTDRDLRSRVLGEGRGPETPVHEVMTASPKTISAKATVFEALLVMLEARIHHLPLVDPGGGEIVGVVTDTDLLRHHLKSPIYLLNRIEKLDRAESFDSYADELAGMVEVLYHGDLDAAQIGRIVSSVHDAVVARVLRLAERELGPPPTPYAWIVFGSEGRREQTLVTDQDNALVYLDASPESERYFSELAERVVSSLGALGIPRCPGGFMATRWRKTLREWEELFDGWIRRPEPQALIEAANFFDFRRIHGELSVESLRELVLDAGRHTRFLAHMARNALGFRPPLGLFRRIRERREGVDLKKGGIIPVVGLARIHALESGAPATGTVDRLEAAAEAGKVSREGADNLIEGFRFLLRLRLGRQLEEKRRGDELDNLVHLSELGPVERRHLKETFVVVQEMQEALGMRYQTSLLG